MLDVILDSFGALLLIGQAAWFLAKGQVEPRPDHRAAARDQDR